ncbi:M56 family metallopeptidase [Chryseosolibacter indicus]|uniref:TonB family protein n=1 Tax=Chryseosolibacter indicus TaxID=2782351 RepID=A0ABS5VNN9_9BACT|nr:M56 family metallopeptidase [Chryseosolibacter indicus]MBT1701641.1 TonB family protein [Chryseosolibacter indicus]
MSTLLNYIVEANLGLLLFLLFYQFLLKKETNFTVVRLVMLLGVLASTAFPLFHFKSNTASQIVPSIGTFSSYLLPEVVITDLGKSGSAVSALLETKSIQLVGMLYITGVVISLLFFLFQVVKIIRLLNAGNAIRRKGNLRILEHSHSTLTFSFFNFILIGNKSALSDLEKEQIIRHEEIHSRQWHSADIFLLSLLKIGFWFNPFIHTYKKIFVQLHEFEADARAVENQDVNRYCNLLARVALQSAGLSLGNHFNNSLTIKRIQMMRTIKSNIKIWKIAACLLMIPLLFFVIACQDQLGNENQDSKNLPAEAASKFETFKKNYAGETFIVEYDKNANQKLTQLENKYGRATHIELFTITDKGEQRSFSMLQYAGAGINSTAEQSTSESNEIFTKVDEVPEYPGGFESMVSFLQGTLRYPESAKSKGIEGTSFISFVVEKDGGISETQVAKGFDAACDAEALRVVQSFPKWTPGKQNGQVVRTRFVIPIKYKL